MDPVILHCDCNSFFASVESIDHPEYKLVPMAVGGDPDKRHELFWPKMNWLKSIMSIRPKRSGKPARSVPNY
jgi:hypothetical protein